MTEVESKLLDVVASLRVENTELRKRIANLLELIEHLSIGLNDLRG